MWGAKSGRTVSAAVVALALAACGASTPPVSDARQILEPRLRKHGEVLDFQKTNGEARDLGGAKGYVLYFRAAVKLNPGNYWITNLIIAPRTQLVPKEELIHYGVSERNKRELPPGTIYVLNGTVTFRLTEKGWVYDSWEQGTIGYCVTPDVASCYKEHRMN